MAAAVEHRHRVADAEPQHARQVLGFVLRQRDGLVAGIERGREEAVHGAELYGPDRLRTCQRSKRTLLYSRARCSSAVRSSASTRSCRRSAAAASARSTSRKTPGSTRRSRSRFRTSRASTSASCCASRGCSPRLNHPNIVTILTAEKQENVFFIVMEFVPGETLEAIIARDGALDLPRALDYTCQICNAVDHAHRHGVLHRDLRPSNVLVADSGMLKVADFGTSRFLEIAAHGTTVIGSPPYMAPEQFQRQGGVRERPLLARRHDVPDADRRAAVRHAVARRSRSPDARRAADRRRGSRIRRFRRRSTTSC